MECAQCTAELTPGTARQIEKTGNRLTVCETCYGEAESVKRAHLLPAPETDMPPYRSVPPGPGARRRHEHRAQTGRAVLERLPTDRDFERMGIHGAKEQLKMSGRRAKQLRRECIERMGRAPRKAEGHITTTTAVAQVIQRGKAVLQRIFVKPKDAPRTADEFRFFKRHGCTRDEAAVAHAEFLVRRIDHRKAVDTNNERLEALQKDRIRRATELLRVILAPAEEEPVPC